MAGLDMSMVPFNASFFYHCVDLAKKDPDFLERVNDATKRILNVKKKLGLLDDNFENVYPVPSDLNKIGTNESENFNLEAARESIILAKNENNVLPLDKKTNKKILVTGPTANLRKVMNGGWSYTWQGDIESAYYHGRDIK
jgi:beta-glucosidase